MDIQRQFVQDPPCAQIHASPIDLLEGRIEGCHAYSLQANSDGRGDLIELLTTRDAPIEPFAHSYQVWAEPGSIRAWVVHISQTDRLYFTAGSFLLALCDLRPESPTAGAIATLRVGKDIPVHLTIAPWVAHGVHNVGAERAAFLNFPTIVYQHESPDKFRLPYDSGLIPFQW